MDDNSNTSPLGTQPGSIVATIVSARSIQRAATTADLRKFVETGRFFWLDIVGSDETVRATFLRELGLKEADSVWAQRFGQTGRMTIGQEVLRTVTWLSEVSPSLTEIHLLASRKYILTVWTGDASRAERNPSTVRRTGRRTRKESLSSCGHRSAIAAWDTGPSDQCNRCAASGVPRAA